MEDVFAKLAITTATMVGKAAFSQLTSLAVKQLGTYVQTYKSASSTDSKNPSSSAKTSSSTVIQPKSTKIRSSSNESSLVQLSILKMKLEQKIAILSPSIDTIQIAAAKTNNIGLSSVLAMSKDLSNDIEMLSDMLNNIDTSGFEEPSQSDGNKDEDKVNQTSITNVTSHIQSILTKIDELLPFINLSLTISGVSLSTNLSSTVSTSLLLQSSSSISVASYQVENRVQSELKNPEEKQNGVRLNPTFLCRFYSLFTASMRKDQVNWTWKEEFYKSRVWIERVVVYETGSSLDSSFDYDLIIEQDLDDGRYHDETEMEDQKQVKLQIRSISRTFFTISGKLLNIMDSKSPVLVLKVVEGDEAVEEEPNQDRRESIREEDKKESLMSTPKKQMNVVEPKWFALEILDESELDDNSSNSDESEDENETTNDVSNSPSKNPSTEKSSRSATSPEETKIPISHSLSHLDLLLRLTNLETKLQQKHTTLSDEKLLIYLTPDSVDSTTDSRTQKMDISYRASEVDSPIHSIPGSGARDRTSLSGVGGVGRSGNGSGRKSSSGLKSGMGTESPLARKSTKGFLERLK
ncbi:RanGTP-binding protein-domain-containing protein [Paraphysoderma sedebokerense]|nr:RanGTP-binding protein-domain-containing protein [Paraphysoderma sedebokerense]